MRANGSRECAPAPAMTIAIRNRDRGEPRGSSPPTPPYVRVRIRRFGGLCRPRCRDGSQAERTEESARPPDLPPRSFMTMDFAISCSLVRPGRPRYPVLVHRAAALLHAFFRPHLAMTPLRFANPSPPSGWIEDFHLQAVVHTRHTRKRPPEGGPPEGGLSC